MRMHLTGLVLFLFLFLQIYLFLFFTGRHSINISDWLILGSSLFFLLSGIKFLKSSSAYKESYDFWESNKDKEPYKSNGRSKTISEQLTKKITKQWTLTTLPILAFLALVGVPFLTCSDIPSGSKELDESQKLYSEPHSDISLSTFDQFATEQGLYKIQAEFLNEF